MVTLTKIRQYTSDSDTVPTNLPPVETLARDMRRDLEGWSNFAHCVRADFATAAKLFISSCINSRAKIAKIDQAARKSLRPDLIKWG